MKLSNKTYDTLKWIAQYLLPAIGTLYFALARIWGLPYGEQIVGTITAVDAFLGAILGISTMQYNKTKEVQVGVQHGFHYNFESNRGAGLFNYATMGRLENRQGTEETER